MISPIDIFCLAVIAGLMVLEGYRGIVPSLVDFVCVLVGVILARIFYVPLSEHMQPSSAYLLIVGVLVILTALLSIFVTRRLKVQVTPVEAAIGGALGLGTALLLSHALFQWIIIRYGGGAGVVKGSLLYWAMSELSGIREVVGFLRKLTGK